MPGLDESHFIVDLADSALVRNRIRRHVDQESSHSKRGTRVRSDIFPDLTPKFLIACLLQDIRTQTFIQSPNDVALKIGVDAAIAGHPAVIVRRRVVGLSLVADKMCQYAGKNDGRCRFVIVQGIGKYDYIPAAV